MSPRLDLNDVLNDDMDIIDELNHTVMEDELINENMLKVHHLSKHIQLGNLSVNKRPRTSLS